MISSNLFNTAGHVTVSNLYFHYKIKEIINLTKKMLSIRSNGYDNQGNVQISWPMVLILHGNSEHVAPAWRKIETKNPIWDYSWSNQMP